MFNDIKKVHIVGIGGIGISALAQLLLKKGVLVSGSDLKERPILKKLKELGASVCVGEHDAKNVEENTDILVYVSEAREDNPEIIFAKNKGIKCLSYAEALGLVMKNYKKVITISGTKGKTTTTSMIGTSLDFSKLNPTVITGSIVFEWDSNFLMGSDDLIVTEACEWKRNFLNYDPDIAVITNIQSEHLDYYKDIEDIKNAFTTHCSKIKSGGILIACGDDENTLEVASKYTGRKVFYGLGENNQVRAINVKKGNLKTLFDVEIGREDAKDTISGFEIGLPGEHNIQNSLASIAVMNELGVDKSLMPQAISNYKGVSRRFEIKGEKNGILVVDDYAHTPISVKKMIDGAKEFYGDRRIVVVFEPHRYSRTRHEFGDFVKAFDSADKVILADIYRLKQDSEEDVLAVNSKMLADEIKKRGVDIVHVPSLLDIPDYLVKISRKGDIIITMGAGDVYRVGEEFIKNNH